MSIGLRKQLFVDDYLIAERTNVTRELGTPIKANNGQPLIVADKPWENADLFRLGAVFRDGDCFRLWYQLNDDLFGYAESADGLHWSKPSLGLREFQGSTSNNLVDAKGLACFLDSHETDPAHKYKSAYGHETVRAALAHSPDGFRWTAYNNGQPVTHRAADTFNQLLWDDDAQVYRLYTRTDFGRGRWAGTLDEDRGTRDMVNPDVKANPTAWRTVREWRFDREGPWEFKRRQVYSLNGWLYEGVHFGLLWCYEWAGDLREGPFDLHKRHERDVLNFSIATTRGSPREIEVASAAGPSRLAVNSPGDAMWDLSWIYAGRPLLPRGRDGSFDKDWVQPSCNIVTWQDKHWLYYCGAKERHDIYRVREGLTRWQCAIGLATLRLDGFVCLEAKDKSGVVVTKPFKLEGGRVEINVAAPNGEVFVEVLDGAGKPLAGFTEADAVPLRAVDELRVQPRWQAHADLSALKGRVVRLRFHLRDTRLYAFQVK